MLEVYQATNFHLKVRNLFANWVCLPTHINICRYLKICLRCPSKQGQASPGWDVQLVKPSAWSAVLVVGQSRSGQCGCSKGFAMKCLGSHVPAWSMSCGQGLLLTGARLPMSVQPC